jgi:hypothetical protein
MPNMLRTRNKGLGRIGVAGIQRTDKPQSTEIQRMLHMRRDTI